MDLLINTFRKDFICFLLVALSVFSIASCQPQHREAPVLINNAERHSKIKHAIGFDFTYESSDLTILHIFRYYNKSPDTLSYALFRKGTTVPERWQRLPKIRVPVQRVALLQSSFVSYFTFCEARDQVRAISEIKYVFDSAVFHRALNGTIREIGFGDALDKEVIISSDIDLALNVGWPNSNNKNLSFLQDIGIPVITFSDWQETTLLGRAEWVKVVGALLDKSDWVGKQFVRIESAYDSLKNLVKFVDLRPKVICNLPYKGTWYVPAGNSYVSNMLKDAGAHYLWSDNDGTGALPLDFEAVYSRGIQADAWINTDYANSIVEIKGQDERFADFRPIKTGEVYNPVRRVARGQANDYWESGVMQPQFILADLIKILHPDKLPGYRLHFYKKLQ